MTHEDAERVVDAAQRRVVATVRDDLLPMYLSRYSLLTTVSVASTADSGNTWLVDQIKSWRSQETGQGITEAGRAEQAGFLTVPRVNQRALTLGDLRNAQYFPLAMKNYRPTGGKVGDVAVYSQSDGSQAILWARQTGELTAQSGGGARVELSAASSDVRITSDLYVNHIAGKDTLPVFVPGPALGGGAGVVLGSDIAMSLTLVSLGGPAGLIGAVQFGQIWTTQPKLSGPMPTSQLMATPPPVGLAAAIYAVITPVQVQFYATSPVQPGIYSFTFTVTG